MEFWADLEYGILMIEIQKILSFSWFKQNNLIFVYFDYSNLDKNLCSFIVKVLYICLQIETFWSKIIWKVQN